MIVGRKVLRLDEATSTNDAVKSLGKEGVEEGVVVLAKRQTSGRGRAGKGWSSPDGGLYMSVLLRPKMRGQELLRMTVFSCVPVAKAIEEVCGIKVQLKWPNDLMIDRAKVGGVLVEGVSKGANLDFVVVGIGLNVNSSLEQIREEGATSLKTILGRETDLETLFDALLRNLENFYESLLQDALDETEYVVRSCTLGREIEATVGKEIFRGKALYLGPDGALVLRSEEGLVLRLAWVNETSIRTTNSEELNVETLRKD